MQENTQETTRALRRHHLKRIKLLCLRQVKIMCPQHPEIWTKQVWARYRNRQPCSCSMCGNPRHHAKGGRKTRQERSVLQQLREV